MTTIPITHRININKKLSAQSHLTTKRNTCKLMMKKKLRGNIIMPGGYLRLEWLLFHSTRKN